MTAYFVHDEIDRQSTWRSSQIAFMFEDTVYTYAEFADRTKRLAGALRAAGLERGDVVVAHAANHVDLYTLFFACSRAGCVFTTVSTFQTKPNVDYIVERMTPSAVFYTDDKEITDGLLPVVRSAAGEARYVSLDPDSVGDDEIMETFLADAKPLDRAPYVAPDDRHNVFWTSGTTGMPKAAARNHVDTLNYSRALAEGFPYEAGNTRLVTTDTDENAIAPAASTGCSSPSEARGIIAVL